MKIRTKILLLFTLGAMVPMLLSHFFATRMMTSSLEERISANLVHSAEQAANRIGDHIQRSIQELSLVVDAIPFENFPLDQLHQALEIPYRQLPGATTIALLDESGKAVALPYSKSQKEAKVLGREFVSSEDLAVFAQNVPLRLALTAEIALGPVYLSSGGSPRMVMARAYKLSDENASWVLAVEMSLEDICKLVSAHNRDGSQWARIIDVQGRSLCAAFADPSKGLPTYSRADFLNRMDGSKVNRYEGAEGVSVLGVIDEVDITGWKLLIEQVEDLALEPVEKSLKWTAVWLAVCLAIALGGGAVLSRELTRPIADLEQAAARVARGDYDRQIAVSSKDELGRLATSFNHMTSEIQAWNAELTERVEERTRALREAREQVIQTQKLAAIGELGSGVAHEINNPLTGVIGMAQLLRSEMEPGSQTADGLNAIINGARRVADVVDMLLKFSQSQVSPEMQPVEIDETVKRALNMFASRLDESEIRVATKIQKGCRVFAKEEDLQLAINHLLDNARRALSSGGQLSIDVGHVEGGAVQITISDTGPGMSEEVQNRAFDPFFTTHNPGSGAKGLGLALVHQVVAEHEGRVMIDSDVGMGTRVSIYLPGAPRLSRD